MYLFLISLATALPVFALVAAADPPPPPPPPVTSNELSTYVCVGTLEIVTLLLVIIKYSYFTENNSNLKFEKSCPVN